MNNLAFALLYWEPWILERKRLHMYTDNNAVRVKGIRPEHVEKSPGTFDPPGEMRGSQATQSGNAPCEQENEGGRL